MFHSTRLGSQSHYIILPFRLQSVTILHTQQLLYTPELAQQTNQIHPVSLLNTN